VTARAREGYETYAFHAAYQALSHFCTVTLSARYFDIIKDRLYTAAPRSPARRSAQTALYRIADALARLLAPILVYTADEIWENLPADESRPASVHLAEFPERRETRDDELMGRWARLFEARDAVLPKLEEARTAKLIGSSLEARVVLTAGESAELRDLLGRYRGELRYLFIVSEVELEEAAAGGGGLTVRVERARGEKCERCWNYSARVGESERYPTACERCVEALGEIEREEGAVS
jgi:isoleucyl-tRNA synthetase